MKKSDLDFVNSSAMIKNRVAVKDYYFDELPQELRRLAFTVSNLETLSMVKIVQTSLENARKEGVSFYEWKNSLNQDAVRSLSRQRLETVYRTNMSSVYNSSTRFNASTAGSTPYLMFSAVGDQRARESHQELDGVIKKASDPFWNLYTPPLGYNCRCTIIPLSEDDAKERGVSTETDFPRPDKGFGDQESIGDVTTGVTGRANEEIGKLPLNSPYRAKFQQAQNNIDSLVDVWWQKNENLFKG